MSTAFSAFDCFLAVFFSRACPLPGRDSDVCLLSSGSACGGSSNTLPGPRSLPPSASSADKNTEIFFQNIQLGFCGGIPRLPHPRQFLNLDTAGRLSVHRRNPMNKKYHSSPRIARHFSFPASFPPERFPTAVPWRGLPLPPAQSARSRSTSRRPQPC